MAEREPLAELEPCFSSEGATPTQWTEARRVLRPGGVFAGTDSADGLLLRLAHLGTLTSRWIPPTSPGGSRRRASAGSRWRGASRSFASGRSVDYDTPALGRALEGVFSAMIAEEFALVFVPVGTVFWPAGWAFLALFFGFQAALVLCLVYWQGGAIMRAWTSDDASSGHISSRIEPGTLVKRFHRLRRQGDETP
jgi:hypothetical protein